MCGQCSSSRRTDDYDDDDEDNDDDDDDDYCKVLSRPRLSVRAVFISPQNSAGLTLGPKQPPRRNSYTYSETEAKLRQQQKLSRRFDKELWPL